MMQFCSSIGSLSGLCRTGIFYQTKSYPIGRLFSGRDCNPGEPLAAGPGGLECNRNLARIYIEKELEKN